MSSPPTSSLFFPADSDEEAERDEHALSPAPASVAPSLGGTPQPHVPPPPAAREALFFPGDDGDGDGDDEDIVLTAAPPGAAGSSQSVPSASAKSPSSSARPAKRGAASQAASQASQPSQSSVRPGFVRGYLGEFVCEGWSLSKGKGYCSPGSKIIFERPKPKATAAAAAATKVGPARIVNGQVVQATKPAIGGKQMTLSAMMAKKAAPPAAKKAAAKKVDQIIRFRNERGFGRELVSLGRHTDPPEVGRLSVNDAGFLVHLMDAGVVAVEGNVIDCPQVLSTGTTILLNIQVFLCRQGFERIQRKDRKEQSTFWQEQQETEEEGAMRSRKESLGALFSRIGVKPLQSNSLLQAQRKAGSAAVTIDEKSLEHFEPKREPASPGKGGGKRSASPAKDKAKGKPARGSDSDDDDDDDEESGDEAEKLNDAQLGEIDNIYRKAQMNDAHIAETEPPDTFLYTLRPYQKQALTWMTCREAGKTNVRDSNKTLHPLWEEYAFKEERAFSAPILIEDDDDEVPAARKFYWNPYSGELSLELPQSENTSRGGILADAMGMGKTCMMASLIHTNRDADPPELEPVPAKDEAEQPAKRRKFVQVTLSAGWKAVANAPKPAYKPPRATLVVCPVSLASQWHQELGKMSAKGTLSSVLWYGNDRPDIGRLLAQEGKKQVDVVITSYGTLVSEYTRWKKRKDKAAPHDGSSIYDHDFLRIVLDEAHNIKNRTAQMSKACYELKGRRRWALSGTPIVNRLEDLFSLLHFMRLEPWGIYSFFRSFVTIPFLNQDPKAINVVQYILESCLLRREKTMRDKDGRLVVDLPPKTVDLQVLNFSRAERKIYKHLEDRAKRRFIELDAEGRAMTNYTSILAMLMRLRQCVDHPLLVVGKGGPDDEDGDRLLGAGGSNDEVKQLLAEYAGSVRPANSPTPGGDSAYAAQVLKELGEAESTPECGICYGEVFDEVLLPCFHRCCQDCVVEYIGHCEDTGREASCPSCGKGPLVVGDLRSVQRRRRHANPFAATDPPPDAAARTVTLGKVDLVSSTKLRALVRKLGEMRAADPLYKALVFSQFTSFLDLIETTLTKEGVRWLRFDGSMSQAQRAATVDEFGLASNEPVVLLISLKAGGVGLNLTMANHVFMMDTWWNEAIEQQAIDRVHRLGQTRPVFVTRFIIRGTVEKRIMKIQRTKTALINASLAHGKKDRATSLADIKKIFGLDEPDSEDDAF